MPPAAELPTWLDELQEGVVLIEDGRVSGINDAAAAVLGVDARAALGVPLISVLRDHRLEELASGPPGRRLELDVRGRRLAVLRVAAGILLSDMTELRRSQTEARELLSVLSHELRTPVAAVRSTLEALSEDDVPERLRRRFLQGALAEAERLSRLLADLTVDVKPPRERSVELGGALSRAAALVAPVAVSREVAVRLEVEALDVWVDEDKLVQAAVNLIENAVLHGPRQAVVTVVSLAGETTAGFEVIDSGAPLSPDRIAELFAVRSLGSVKAKGTGLGLYIVRSLARSWGGSAWGRPLEDGSGNAFGVDAPLASDEQAAAQRVKSSSGSTAGDKPR